MRRGFTLVELLVVVAVIALLLSILVPTYVHVYERARRTGCQNNHHQIIVGGVQYAGEWDSHFPFCNWLAPERNGDWNGPGWLYYYDQLTNYDGERFVPADRQKGTLWKYSPNADTYRCPMEPPPYKERSTHVLTSYHMNGATVAYYRNGLLRLFRTTDMIGFAGSDAILYWEADDQLWNDGSSFPGEGMTRRHGDGATVGCAGGHTAWLTHEEYQEELGRKPGRLWCNPASPDGT